MAKKDKSGKRARACESYIPYACRADSSKSSSSESKKASTVVTTCHASEKRETIRWGRKHARKRHQTGSYVRWRIDLWEPLECRRLDTRDVEDSEIARDRSGGGLCRLLCEGGTAKGPAGANMGMSKSKDG